MKKMIKIIAIIYLLLFQLNIKTNAQLLKAGDAVVSFNDMIYNFAGSPAPTNLVLEILHTSNTAAALPNVGAVANPALSWPSFSYFDPSWTSANLGKIFGITIDNNKNIFVSATGFFGPQPVGKSTGAIYKIDAFTGAITPWFNFNPGGTENDLSLGNIKYFNGNLYVSNLKDGKLYAVSATTANTPVDSYLPTGFSLNDKPCGLAIRTIAGSPKLYFSRNGFNAATTAIFSVNLLPSGMFGATQTLEIPTAAPANNNDPITDIAFSKDNQQIIFSQITASGTSWSNKGAHAAKAYKYIWSGSAWIYVPSNFQIGTYAAGTNSAGGLDFSDIAINTNKAAFCDTAIYVTSNAIFIGNSPAPTASWVNCYGMSGFNNNQPGAGSSNGINIDFNNEQSQQFKGAYGDVEICDSALNCTSCGCGQWGPDGFTITKIDGTSSKLKCGSSYSIAQNNFSGQLNATYLCTGNCPPSYKWELLKNSTLVNTGISLPINLTTFNSLQCGDYTLRLMAKCGDSQQYCPDTCTIQFVVTCDPPPCCKENDVSVAVAEAGIYTPASTSGPNAFGTLAQSFTLNATALMTEIRVDIAHFELQSNNPACIPCINKPITWGSLQSATFNGNPMVKPAGVVAPYFPGVVFADLRELIYKPGSLFPVTNAPLNIVLGMPNIPEIDCCELWVNICVKITYKDANCRECIKIVCLERVPIKKADKNGKRSIKSTISNSNF